MQKYENDFVYGRSLVKKGLIAAFAVCVVSLLVQNPTVRVGLMVLSMALIGWVIYTLVKYCRCPHCGKHVTLGVLAVKQCPRCKYSLETGKKIKKMK